MPPAATALLLCCSLSAPPLSMEGTTEVRYSGAVAQLVPGGQRTPVKQFDLLCLIESRAADAWSVVFLTNEDGGGMPWTERFGLRTYAAGAAGVEGRTARLLHAHAGRQNPIDVPLPLFPQRARLTEDAAWDEDGLHYDVARSRQVGEYDCWQVDVTGQAARNQTLNVHKVSGLIVSGSRRLVMGQGDLFELTFQLESVKRLPPEAAARLRNTAETLLKLQSTLDRKPEEIKPHLNARQLAAAREALTALTADAEGTPFQRLVGVIGRDVQAQQQRAKSVDDLVQKFVGQAAPDYRLTRLDGTPADAAARTGKVVVLHFWNYQDEPLEEPYGQVGYLDFLLNRHQQAGVVVYGVASDARLRDPASANAAKRSIRKLKDFMNLGYDVTLDPTGEALQAFGDPTQFDADLPLWVVIGRDGKVAHYRTGYYAINRDKGLEELDAVVSRLLSK